MEKKRHFLLSPFRHKYKFHILLISFFLFLVIRPFLENFVGVRLLVGIFVTLILLSALLAVSQKKSAFIVACLIALPMLIAQWTGYFVSIPYIAVVGRVFGALFYAYTAIVILSYVYREKEVNPEVISGAVCVYLLLGMMWAYVYSSLETFQPGSFQSAGELGSDLSDFTYFSFVTLSTLGYGDITPATVPARSLAIVEAIIGQLYIAVMIAGLVGVYISNSRK